MLLTPKKFVAAHETRMRQGTHVSVPTLPKEI